MELRPHQVKALEKLRTGSVLAGRVGSGKTLTALAYYVQIASQGFLDRSEPMRTPKDLLIVTTAMKRDGLDWEKEALNYGLSVEQEFSYGHRKFVVDSWNNIKKYKDLEGWFIIFDEQRLVGSGVWVKTFLKMVKKNDWILLSATPADTWMDYVPVFIANGFYRNRTHFIDEHVVWSFHGNYRKVRGFYGVSRLRKCRDQILVEMPYDHHTTRHVITTEVDYDFDMFRRVWVKRWNVLENKPLVDVAEKYRIARRVVNEDPSRLDKIEELSAKHPRLVIFYNFDYELYALRTLMTRLDIPVTEWNGHRHEDVPETPRWLYLVQYQAGSEGWNCTSTDAMVFYSLTYSHRQYEQAQGRIDRMDTTFDDLWYYVLMSDAKVDSLIWRALVAKKNFHEGKNRKY